LAESAYISDEIDANKSELEEKRRRRTLASILYQRDILQPFTRRWERAVLEGEVGEGWWMGLFTSLLAAKEF
jgi:hypothetical protein